jgi:hypothetical protein
MLLEFIPTSLENITSRFVMGQTPPSRLYGVGFVTTVALPSDSAFSATAARIVFAALLAKAHSGWVTMKTEEVG